ncbi:MAG TPA: helix-hairpin-helix domain-containing protein [Patescibacteria group bacterium]|nr:helix-hairpin-helix domain-containing protein [Patescibacteria group bacterium]
MKFSIQPKATSSRFRGGRAPGSFNLAQAGIALIIVMISIFVLTVLAGGLATAMKVETKLARNANSESELEWLGRSAVECARWELAQQLMIPQEPYDALNQVWAGGIGGAGTSNSPLSDFKNEIQTKDGSATWKIIDLERKANINVANEAILQQSLLVMGVDAGQMTPVVNSILDWIDRDENPRIQGAESDFYQGLTPPYFAKNGPIDDISELLLIKGAADFYGAADTSQGNQNVYNPLTSRFSSAGPVMPATPVGLTNLFTPLSTGKININTASAEVLQLIPSITAEAAQGIVSARDGEDDGSGMFGPYRNLGEVRRVPEVSLPMLGAIQQFCGVRSGTFEVHVDAQVAGYHRHFVGIIGRNNPRDVQILSFYWTD